MSNYEFIEIKQQGDVSCVLLVNPQLLDRLLIHELGDELIEFIESETPKKLLVNFEKVSYCSSEVIGGLIRARRRITDSGGQLKLCSMETDVQRLFRITHLEGTIFDIYDTAEQAMDAFSAPA